MNIAIGTTRIPKVRAAKAAFKKAQHFLGHMNPELLFLPFDVETGVSDMPLNLHELTHGAMIRAQNARTAARAKGIEPDFAIGLEGVFLTKTEEGNVYFLQSWAYVLNRKKGAFGSSGAMPVPAVIVRDVVERKQELGNVIDRYGLEEDIRSKGGAYDVFSKGIINREQSFELAITCALAPFISSDLYDR